RRNRRCPEHADHQQRDCAASHCPPPHRRFGQTIGRRLWPVQRLWWNVVTITEYDVFDPQRVAICKKSSALQRLLLNPMEFHLTKSAKKVLQSCAIHIGEYRSSMRYHRRGATNARTRRQPYSYISTVYADEPGDCGAKLFSRTPSWQKLGTLVR